MLYIKDASSWITPFNSKNYNDPASSDLASHIIVYFSEFTMHPLFHTY